MVEWRWCHVRSTTHMMCVPSPLPFKQQVNCRKPTSWLPLPCPHVQTLDHCHHFLNLNQFFCGMKCAYRIERTRPKSPLPDLLLYDTLFMFIYAILNASLQICDICTQTVSHLYTYSRKLGEKWFACGSSKGCPLRGCWYWLMSLVCYACMYFRQTSSGNIETLIACFQLKFHHLLNLTREPCQWIANY